MATARPFAYNTSGTIAGTTQVGDLAIGFPTSGFTNSPQFWNGPDEELGYVIAHPVSANTQPTPIIISAPTKLLTLSSIYIGNDISVTNGGQTASQGFGYQQTVLGNAQIDPSSKIMFSILVNLLEPGALADSHIIGIGRTSMNYKSIPPYGAYPGNDNQSMGYCSNGTLLYNGSVYSGGGGLQTWTDNDVIDIVIDNNIAGMWVRVNGGYWNNDSDADPSTGSLGFEIINAPFYPALCPGYQGIMTIQNSAEYGVPSGYTLLGSNETASVGFFRSSSLTDNSFIELTNSLFNQSFTTAPDASNWLTTNGFWNSYGITSENWYLYNIYQDATNNGEITFPNHNISSGDLNPNNVGQAYGGTATQLYINTHDTLGVSFSTELGQLVGAYGNLTLTQGSNSVTYSFTNEAFETIVNQLYSDYVFGGSVPNSLCVTSFASGNFNTTNPIVISYSAYPSSYTFTLNSSMVDSMFNIGDPQYGDPNGTTGFTISTQINNLWNGVVANLNTATTINDAFIAAGAIESYSGYIALVQWGPDSTYQSGLAKIAVANGTQLFITSVDGSDSNFTQTGNNDGSNLVGTFNFPATFTLITPLINKASWC